jgi:NADPH:quinone reductase-like Zn-dependent oxidoreductase
VKYFEVHEFGPPEVLRLIDAPGIFPAPGENEVQIKVMAAGINYADLMARSGDYPPVSSNALPARPRGGWSGQ